MGTNKSSVVLGDASEETAAEEVGISFFEDIAEEDGILFSDDVLGKEDTAGAHAATHNKISKHTAIIFFVIENPPQSAEAYVKYPSALF